MYGLFEMIAISCLFVQSYKDCLMVNYCSSIVNYNFGVVLTKRSLYNGCNFVIFNYIVFIRLAGSTSYLSFAVLKTFYLNQVCSDTLSRESSHKMKLVKK